MSRVYKKPADVSWPLWKFVLVGLGGSILWIFIIWVVRVPVAIYHANPRLTISDILLGSVWLLFAFWRRWAWQRGRKYRHWHNWMEGLFASIYITLLPLCGGIAYWNHALNYPWNYVVNGVLVTLFILVWAMPILSYPTAKKLSQIPWSLSGLLIPFAGVAGSGGALFGMYAYRNGQMRLALLVMGSMLFLLAFMIASGGAQYIWERRPWAKKDE